MNNIDFFISLKVLNINAMCLDVMTLHQVFPNIFTATLHSQHAAGPIMRPCTQFYLQKKNHSRVFWKFARKNDRSVVPLQKPLGKPRRSLLGHMDW